MLVLKGGRTSDWESFDNPWQPIDDFQAPYREPVLPPPDFDPDTLDIGVGVPIETIVQQREREKKIRAKKIQIFAEPANVREKETAETSKEKDVEHEVYSRVTNNINDFQAVLAPENKLKPFKEEVERSQDEFRQFLDDVSKFISDMENFHSVKQSASQSLPRSVPRPTPTPPTTSPSPSTAFTSQTPRSVSWRSNISDPVSSSPFPVSYVSPYAKVYLSTKYVSKVSTTTTSPLRSQVSADYIQTAKIILIKYFRLALQDSLAGRHSPAQSPPPGSSAFQPSIGRGAPPPPPPLPPPPLPPPPPPFPPSFITITMTTKKTGSPLLLRSQ